jgi:hypothetical protein
MPKVARQSESLSLNWDTSNLRRHYGQIIQQLFGILKETIKQKRSKAMDMRYHWLTDRVHQKQFDV